MTRSKHSKKEVEEALSYAEEQGWRIEVGGSHCWGQMYCPNNKGCRGGMYCRSSINGSPRNAGTHAKQIRKAVDKCTDVDNPAADG